MLKTLTLKNFRCFSHHEISFNEHTLLVGSNNAGKSTVIEALRLLSLVCGRFGRLNFSAPPPWHPAVGAKRRNLKGLRPSMEGLQITTRNIFHHHQDPPAEIIAVFTNGVTIELLVGPDAEVFAVVRSKVGKIVTTKSATNTIQVPRLVAMPPPGPLLADESTLTPEYVRSRSLSNLTPRHFRNQVALFDQYQRRLGELVKDSWPGLMISEMPARDDYNPADPIVMLVRERDFTTEVGWTGSGLQTWLQIMWFVAQHEDTATLVLDEPDVFVHADLQRRLIRLLQALPAQTIIASHSIEMIAETPPQSIVIVDKSRGESRVATSVPAVQSVVDQIGGVHNLQLVRLVDAKRFLLVEGKDLKFLSVLYDTLFPGVDPPLDVLPHASLGGRSGWKMALGSQLFVTKAFPKSLKVYCVLDADHHTVEENTEVYEAAKKHGLSVHIWKRKEVENYLIVPSAISRLASRKANADVSESEIVGLLDEISEAMKTDTEEAIAAHYQNLHRCNLKSAMEHARTVSARAWTARSERWGLIGGKTALATLRRELQARYKVSFNDQTLLYELRADELDAELVGILTKIRDVENF